MIKVSQVMLSQNNNKKAAAPMKVPGSTEVRNLAFLLAGSCWDPSPGVGRAGNVVPLLW